MKKGKITDEQIAYALRRVDGGTPGANVCRQIRVSKTSFHVWKKKYGHLGVGGVPPRPTARRGRRASEAGGRGPHARQTHPAGYPPPKPVTPVRRRARPVWMREAFHIPVARACRFAGFSRASWYRPSTAKDQSAVHLCIRELAMARPRFGSQRIHILLRREGWKINKKRARRLHRLDGLHPRMCVRRRKHMALHRGAAPTPAGLHQRWRMDFVHDQLFEGRPFRVLTDVDQWSRQSPVLETGFSLTERHVVAGLERIAAVSGYPKSITVDHGTEFTSRALETWVYYRGVQLDFTRSGKPTDNSHIESFNGRLRDECLNVHQFLSLTDAQAKIEAWRQDYNTRRPHSALGQLTSNEFASLRQDTRAAETLLLQS